MKTSEQAENDFLISYTTESIVNSFISRTFDGIIKYSFKNGLENFEEEFAKNRGCWIQYSNENEVALGCYLKLDGEVKRINQARCREWFKNAFKEYKIQQSVKY